jgi:hypothetical protein
MTVPMKSALTLVLLAGGLYLAFGPKTARWTEEVALNTGETIWVERIASYSLKGDAGNPFDMAFRPDWAEEISFEWNGKHYAYKGDAHLLVLAISPNGRPTLVASAVNRRWDWQHDYRCTVPHYVELIPHDQGTTWHWPSAIERWTYGLPTNLLSFRGKPGRMLSRYTTKEKAEADKSGVLALPSTAAIDPAFTAANSCKKGD